MSALSAQKSRASAMQFSTAVTRLGPLLLSLLGGVVTVQSADDLLLHHSSVVHFATEEEGRKTLATPDRFLSSLSPFDRQSRIETDQEVSQEAFVEFLQSHVRPWTEEEQTKLAGVIAALRPRFAAFRLPFPPTVALIKTTGREEGGAAYCRRHAIVLPQSKVAAAPRDLERLLTHELFHILSAHDQPFRTRCYQVIGFRVIAPPELPMSLRDRKITNPDGPLLDAVIDVMVDGKQRSVVPVLFSSERRFDPVRGGPFFKYLTFRLLVCEMHDRRWQAVERDGEPWLLIPSETADYGRQIGANTGYIIHPDEVLADNFVHLVERTPDLRSPQIVAGLQAVVE